MRRLSFVAGTILLTVTAPALTLSVSPQATGPASFVAPDGVYVERGVPHLYGADHAFARLAVDYLNAASPAYIPPGSVTLGSSLDVPLTVQNLMPTALEPPFTGASRTYGLSLRVEIPSTPNNIRWVSGYSVTKSDGTVTTWFSPAFDFTSYAFLYDYTFEAYHRQNGVYFTEHSSGTRIFGAEQNFDAELLLFPVTATMGTDGHVLSAQVHDGVALPFTVRPTAPVPEPLSITALTLGLASLRRRRALRTACPV